MNYHPSVNVVSRGESVMKLTPLEMHDRAKQVAEDSLVLIRVGDYYEMFHEDALVASRVLGLRVMMRCLASENLTPMSLFPCQYLDSYLLKLVAAGHRVAVVEVGDD